MDIILASKSPRRKQLLSILGLKFEVISSDFDESDVVFNISPQEFCESLAYNKAKVVADKFPNKLVIGADTIVFCDNKIYPKPKNNNIASFFLNELSNKTHHVYTGISLIMNGKAHTFHECTAVTFKKISKNEIEYYINNFCPIDKAGAYGIQDWSSIFVKKIEGCYFNVVGFPISKFYTELQLIYPKILENLLVSKLKNV